MIRKNDRFNVTIEDYSAEGHGIAKKDGYVLFIPGGAVGDTAEVHVVKALRSFGYAKILRLITPSPDRISADCPVSNRCGGCAFRHIDYAAELAHKADKVKNALCRIGGIENPPMLPAIGASEATGYRNKAQYPIRQQDGKTVAGFYATGSHRVIETQRCVLQPQVFDKLLAFTLEFMQTHGLDAYNEETHTGLVRHLYLRRGEKSGEIMVCLVINGHRFPEDFLSAVTDDFPEVKCVCLNENREKTNVILGKNTRFLTERTYILDTLCGKEFAISPASFYQVNPTQTERLYTKAAELAGIDNTQTVLDLYCGIGTVGICAASVAKTLVGIEIIPEAVDNAAANARRNHLTNTRFLCADAGSGTQLLIDEGYRLDTIFVDPPRKGCDNATLEAICTLAPKKLVYISCDPATLARDVKYLADKGYKLISATPVDLFPRTVHVETVCLLSRR
ncbi:MAG: 23S rRNA (uracil(1939)-C(5))-methyltransferase RlmD [Clostridia bacterium]|nr:23S rRNA (uracil(1939)-C(5))-methyltransferase RlmD [Clostridia bacterium]